ncbi:unnamed protein product [Leuciscus chuanchicus]
MAPKMCGTTNPPSTTDDTEELTNESKCSHTAVSHPNQTSPELSPLTKVGEGLDDEMAPKMCGTTNPPSTTDDTEELTNESKCTHTAVSHPNQTSPELSPLTKVGEGLDDEMAPKMCGTTNPPSTTDDTEELTNESKCTHTAVSHPNQTSPELSPLTKVGEEEATTQNNAQLAKLTLAQIIVFNRRRAGEVSKIRLKSFHERDNTKLHEDVARGLSKTEQKLCNYFSRIEIMGKKGRKVAVLLTPSVVNALSLLASRSTECGVCATNVFLFARPTSMSHYRGQDCLRVHASQCGVNLKHNELDQVADFLGHDIPVHRDFYRLPVPTTQLAKISKLLLSMEKGNLSSMQGKSLDEIEIEDEIALSDAEDSGSESDDSNTDLTASEFGTVEPMAIDSTTTEQDHDMGDFGSVSSRVSESVPPSEVRALNRSSTQRHFEST